MKNKEDIKRWVDSEQWYQKIELNNGITTNGKVSIDNRLKHFENIPLKNKSFIDVGCNSGGYCLWAKKEGAKRVVGYDIDGQRIKQANKLKEIEGLDIDFVEKNIYDINTKEKFDIVFCISVITEVEDVIGALKIIKEITRDIAFIEISLAKPVFYFSLSKKWLSGYKTVSRRGAVMEIRETKRGYMIAPSIDIIKAIFGESFLVNRVGKGERYDLLQIKRI
jgi:SAM-dependent methyltransferase